jgi:hypothetical protein
MLARLLGGKDMDLSGLIGGSLVAGIVLLAINTYRDRRKSKRQAASQLQAMLLDVERIEFLAKEYLKPATPKTPAYRMPMSLLEGCIVWFAGGSKMRVEELRPMHHLLGDAQEVDRCLEQAEAARIEAADREDGSPPHRRKEAEIARAKVKCENALANAMKVRAATRDVLARLGGKMPDE